MTCPICGARADPLLASSRDLAAIRELRSTVRRAAVELMMGGDAQS